MSRAIHLLTVVVTFLIVSGCGGSSGSAINTNVQPENAGNSSTFCSPVDNTVVYESFNDGSLLIGNWYVPAPVDGFGWDGSNFCDQGNSTGTENIAVLVPQVTKTLGADELYAYDDPVWSTAAFTSVIDGERLENVTDNLLESSVTGYEDGARSGDWRAVHDGDQLYIYFYARAEGSATGNPQVWLDSVDPRDDDSIEIFIDADNSKNTTYDGVNDYHVIIATLDTSGTAATGPNSADNLDVSFRIDSVTSPSTSRMFFWYVVSISLESAGIEPGMPFGFEIQLNDDDNGGVRDAKFGWHEPAGSAVAQTNPGVFGTLLLTTCEDQNSCGPVQQLRP